MTNDTLGDMLIRIKNAYFARHDDVVIPKSKLKLEILRLLTKLGYIKGIEEKEGNIIVALNYVNSLSVLTDIVRISKPGLRRYTSVADLKSLKRGLGFFILSTPKGIRTHVDAQKEKVGGELLFRIW